MIAVALLVMTAGASLARPPPPEAPTVSTELLDPEGLSRFHLVTRTTLSDGEQVFSSGSAWSYEARAHLRLLDGLALNAVLPIGVVKPPTGRGATAGFVGNVQLGVAGGFRMPLEASDPGSRMELRFGGGLDFYIPSAPDEGSPELLRAEQTIAAIRAYEPQLYLPRLLSFRPRVYADLIAGDLQAALELGIVPAWTVSDQSHFVMLFGAAGRVSMTITEEIEPFLEAGCSTQVGGEGQVTPPFLMTLGTRFHIAELLAPAVFVSFNFVTPSAVILGIDLAGAIRANRGKPPRDENREDFDDFIEG